MSVLRCGQRTLPELLDEKALHTPGHACLSIPLSESCQDYRDISYVQLSRAVDAMAWWIHKTLGTSNTFETLCYLGPPDVQYFIFSLASCKTGFKSLFPSPRNAVAGHLNLLEKAACTKLIGPQERMFSCILDSADAAGLQYTEIPGLDHWLGQDGKCKKYQADMSHEKLHNKPFVVLHTSGSTGLPKPIEITHGLVSVVDNWSELPSVDGKMITLQRCRATRVLCCLPPFHSAGQNLWWASLLFDFILVFPPASSVTNVDVVRSILKSSHAEAGVMAPSILEELSHSEDVSKLVNWKFVMFGGAPLSRDAGNRIWKYTRVYSLFGSTETKCWPELEPTREDEWPYHNFHPQLGLESKNNTADLYELVFRRKPELAAYQAAFHTFPDKQEFSTNDVFSRHETKSNLWVHRGRADDTIILSNGEKFNPQDLELKLTDNEHVKAALVCGNGEFEPSVLIEPTPKLLRIKTADRAPMIMNILEPLNGSHLPSHAEIDEHHIHVFRETDVFPRSSKGAIQRQPALKQLKDTVRALYRDSDLKRGSKSWNLSLESQESLEQTLLDSLRTEYKNLVGLHANDSLFDHGTNSLQIIKISRKLSLSLSKMPAVSARLIYQNPTVCRLSERLMALSGRGSVDADTEGDELNAMRAAIEKYRYKASSTSETSNNDENKLRDSVVLTGSTGRLGAYILHSLLTAQLNGKVYCINRSDDAPQRQGVTMKAYGLTTDLTRCVFMTADLAQADFALSKCELEMLRNATHIIHNAWNVDFNLPFSSFIPSLKASHNLVCFAAEGHQRLMFISSVGAANCCKDSVPESLVDVKCAESMGYARSKLVAEHIFSSSPVPATIVRVGQIAGPVQREMGEWNKKEWFPSLMISSKHMGMMPDLGAMQNVDWLPSDELGDILVEMLFSEGDSIGVLHAVNPNPRAWSEIWAETEERRRGEALAHVPLNDWIARLKTETDLERYPSLKLIGFYEALLGDERPRFSTSRSRRASRKLDMQGGVQGGWVDKWCEQWVRD